MPILHDGQIYNDGDPVHDLGSFELTGYDGNKRFYSGFSADVGKLPKYDSLASESTAYCLDTGDFYYYNAQTKTWIKQ